VGDKEPSRRKNIVEQSEIGQTPFVGEDIVTFDDASKTRSFTKPDKGAETRGEKWVPPLDDDGVGLEAARLLAGAKPRRGFQWVEDSLRLGIQSEATRIDCSLAGKEKTGIEPSI
jgi:hypothetical protein